jgi:hypothetical protein
MSFRRVQSVLQKPSHVSFIFSLRDAAGHAVLIDPAELEASTRIWENDVEIDYTETNFFIHAAENLRLDVALVLDFTNSMKSWNDGQRTAIDVMVQGAKDIIDQVSGSHRVAALEYHDREVEPSVLYDFSTDKAAVKSAIDQFGNSGFDYGSTRCWDGVYDALELFQATADPDNVRVVIFLTDGNDTSSDHSPADCIGAAQTKGVQLYVIGCGSVYDEANLQNMASSTDGLYYRAADLSSLQQHLAQVIRDLGGQYKASYVTLKPASSGTFAVKLKVEHEGLSAEHTENLDLGAIYGDTRVGIIDFDESEIQNAKADVFVRAEHVPRNITAFRFKLETNKPWAPSVVAKADGGLCEGWTFSGPDAQGYYLLSGQDSIPFGDFGVLWKMAFSGINESELVIPFTLDNTIYPNDKSFTYPAHVVLGASWVTELAENFEGSFPTGWGVAGTPTWGRETYRSHTGQAAAWCVGSSLTPPGSYPNNADAQAVYGPFSLAGTDSAYLTFYRWLQSELNYDYLWWGASTDGVNFTGDELSGEYPFWSLESLDLGSFCGQAQVWIRFRFSSDNTITYEGAWIDDVLIRRRIAAGRRQQ